MGENESEATLTVEDPEQIQAEIERTRRELGDTVAELAARADLRARSQERVTAAKERTAERVEAVRGSSPPLLVVGAVVAAIAGGVLLAWRRSAG